MRCRVCWKKGAILLQTLVLSVILSMISVMVMKWVLARYTIVNRIQQSAKNTGNAQGYAAFKASVDLGNWAIPSESSPYPPLDKPTLFKQAPGIPTKFTTTVSDEY